MGSSGRSSTRWSHRNHDRKWDWYVAVVPAVNRGLPRNVASSCHDAASGATPIRRWNRPSSRTCSDTVRSDFNGTNACRAHDQSTTRAESGITWIIDTAPGSAQ